MSKIIKDRVRIFVRYVYLDEDEVIDTKWLAAEVVGHVKKGRGIGPRATLPKRDYETVKRMSKAYDWLEAYDGDRDKALGMAQRLMKIVGVGRNLIRGGWRPEIVLVRDVTKRYTVVVDENNPMVVLAVSAMG